MLKLYFGFIIIYLLSINPVFAQEEKSKDITFLDKGIEYYDLENYLVAVQYFDSAIVVNTENTEAYAFRGISKFMLTQYKEAKKDFDLCLILTPGYAEVYYYRALCQLELDQQDAACEDFYLAYAYGFRKAKKMIKNICEKE